ncbi:tripartite tricarboxylate transporter TctB family protein [Paraburkholderia xenovorans]
MKAESLLLRVNKDYYGGALLLVIGLYVTFVGRTYEVGTLNQMGPGYFPVTLGVLLSMLGIIVALGARRGSTDSPEATDHNEAPRTADWRGWLCIIFSVIAFVVLGQYCGFIPASFATVFISAMGDRENTWKSACVLAVLATVFGIIVFEYALKIQLPMIAFGG